MVKLSRKKPFGDIVRVGQKVKTVRDLKGFTQKEFAKPLGIKQSHISAIEKGETYPSELLILHMCNTYKINRDWLENDQGEMFNEEKNTLKGSDTDQDKFDWEMMFIIQESLDEFCSQKRIKLTKEKRRQIIMSTYDDYYHLQANPEKKNVERSLKNNIALATG